MPWGQLVNITTDAVVEVLDWSQQQTGTRFRSWILEPNSGTPGPSSKAEETDSYMDFRHWRRGKEKEDELDPHNPSALYQICLKWNGIPTWSVLGQLDCLLLPAGAVFYSSLPTQYTRFSGVLYLHKSLVLIRNTERYHCWKKTLSVKTCH